MAIETTREGFEWASTTLTHAMSHHTAGDGTDHEEWQRKLQSSPVRVQRVLERDLSLRSLDYRSIQIGLSGEAVGKYFGEWVVSTTDMTNTMRKVDQYLKEGRFDAAKECLPEEEIHFLPGDLLRALRMD